MDLLTLASAVVVTAAVAGLLELLVLFVQYRVMHQVGLHTLTIHQHIGWMIPAAEALVVIPLALAAILPAHGWLLHRRSRVGSQLNASQTRLSDFYRSR